MKAIDLTKQKFGRLTVIERDYSRKSNAGAYWLCQCECGNIVSVLSGNLKKGATKSCGCLAKEKRAEKSLKDETGKRYGKLTVIERDYSRKAKDNKAYWFCKCDCGNVISVDGGSLRKGSTSSCGCGIFKSKGEEKIAQILKENNISFERQKTFDTCRFKDTNALAYFDFYLPDYNLLIEYDGKQHFVTQNQGWDTQEKLQYTQQHDRYKNQWCKDNNISLIRIPYTKYDNLSINMLIKS